MGREMMRDNWGGRKAYKGGTSMIGKSPSSAYQVQVLGPHAYQPTSINPFPT